MKLLGGKRCRTLLFSLLVIFLAGMIYFGYFCPDQVCALSSGSPTPQYKTPLEAYLKGELFHEEFTDTDLDRDYNFDIEGEDVLVFLHVQKTGGTTFGRHLVKNIQLSIPCKCKRGRKRCKCTNSQKKIWLFSRYSTGWACGLHADWTELQACVEEALDKVERSPRRRRYRYLYISILRDPIMRYLSEWKHVQRGSTWLAAKLRCNGREATLVEVPFCFQGLDWSGVSLDDFLNCPHNLAANRLTRMFSNLSMVNCYNRSGMSQAQRDVIVLQSAKDNLQNMAFFGLTEYQKASQYMFERTFKLKFIEPFIQRNVTHAGESQLTEKQKSKVIETNRMDIEFYQFAKDLFFQRLRHFLELDAQMNITQPPDLLSLAWDSSLNNPGGGLLNLGGSNTGVSVSVDNNNSDNNNFNNKNNDTPGSSKSMPKRRHKYRSEKEVALAEEDEESKSRTAHVGPVAQQGFLVSLNHGQLSDSHHTNRQYPLHGPPHSSVLTAPQPDTSAQLLINDRTKRVSYKRKQSTDYGT